MEFIQGGRIDPIDLINLSKDIAQLNLGYLGISVAILGVLGGVFIYFNIKPIKDALIKQEKAINEIKKEATGLLLESKSDTAEKLDAFKKELKDNIDSTLDRERESISLETVNKIQEVESSLNKAIEQTSESKDLKVKELVLSEIKNEISGLDKKVSDKINDIQSAYAKDFSEIGKENTSLKVKVKNLERDIKELKIFKFSKEGKMGAIIYSIDLLKEDIDANRWSILKSLERLKDEIADCELESEYVADIEEQLARLEGNSKYKLIISEIRKKYIK